MSACGWLDVGRLVLGIGRWSHVEYQLRVACCSYTASAVYSTGYGEGNNDVLSIQKMMTCRWFSGNRSAPFFTSPT